MSENKSIRKINIDVYDLIDIYYAGISSGEMEENLKDYLEQNLKITKEEIKIYGKLMSQEVGYGKEDEEAVNDFAENDW